jgi:hypothetical protein
MKMHYIVMEYNDPKVNEEENDWLVYASFKSMEHIERHCFPKRNPRIGVKEYARGSLDVQVDRNRIITYNGEDDENYGFDVFYDGKTLSVAQSEIVGAVNDPFMDKNRNLNLYAISEDYTSGACNLFEISK